jgi:hypothetical protein
MSIKRPSFKIICQDSLKWLKEQPDNSIPNFVTGIPDLNEFGDNFDQGRYITLLNEIAKLILKKVKKDGYAIFIQTDRKINGQLIDKSYLLTHCAYECGFKLVWHKIVCQRDVGKKDLFRPTYSHFLCYTVHGSPGAAFEDVLPVGGKLYENATPYNAALSAADFLSKQIKKQKNEHPYDVVDPFIGQGTIGIAALQKGLSFLGIDIDPEQCRLSQGLLDNYITKYH